MTLYKRKTKKYAIIGALFGLVLFLIAFLVLNCFHIGMVTQGLVWVLFSGWLGAIYGEEANKNE